MAISIAAPERDSQQVGAMDVLRLGCAVLILLHAFGYLSPLWAWVGAVLAIAILSGIHLLRFECNSIDYAIVSLWLFEVATLRFSSLPSNGWTYVEQLSLAIAAYFAVSRLRSTRTLAVLAVFFCGVTVATALHDVSHFLRRFWEWQRLDFGSIADVRQSLAMVDSKPVGAHYTIYLVFLTWGIVSAFIPSKKAWLRWAGSLAICAGLIGVLIGLSRGIYLAVVVASSAACFGFRLHSRKVFPARSGLKRLSAAVILLTLGLLLESSLSASFAADAPSTPSSAARSVQGRLFLWKQVLRRATARPLLGFGARTLVLYGTEGIAHESGEAVDRAFSFPAQLLFERGFVGVLVYAGFFFIVFQAGLANIRSAGNRSRAPSRQSWVAIAGIAALLIRDLTYTTLFDDKAVTVGLFTLIAVLAFEQRTPDACHTQRSMPDKLSSFTLLLATLVLGTIVTAHEVREASANWYAAQAIDADSVHDEAGAQQLMLRAFGLDPNPYFQAQAGLFSSKSARIALQESPTTSLLAGAILDNNQSLANAELSYKLSLEDLPREAAWQHNLAWLLWYRGDRATAAQRVLRALKLEPGTALYRESLILMLVSQSNFSAAENELVRLLTLAPEVVDSQWWETLALTQSQIVRSALQQAISQLAAEAALDPLQMARRSRLYLEAGDIASAQPLLEKSLRELPAMSGAWRNYGMILARNGDWSSATKALERAVFLDPWDSAAYYALSQVVLHLGPGGEAPAPLRRLSFIFRAKAVRAQAALGRSPESLRASRRLQIQTPVTDDLVVEGLLEFCRPRMNREYEKVVQASTLPTM